MDGAETTAASEYFQAEKAEVNPSAFLSALYSHPFSSAADVAMDGAETTAASEYFQAEKAEVNPSAFLSALYSHPSP